MEDMDMGNSRTVRLKVSEIMRERGLSVAEFARLTGLAYNTASALSRGHFDRIGMDTIASICTGLGVEPSDLFDYSPDAQGARGE